MTDIMDMLSDLQRDEYHDIRQQMRSMQDVIYGEILPRKTFQNGESEFRAIDDNGITRVIMSALNLMEELGIDGNIAVCDTSGTVMFYVSPDGIKFRRGSGVGNKIVWETSGGATVFQIGSAVMSGPGGDIALTTIEAQGESGETTQLTATAQGSDNLDNTQMTLTADDDGGIYFGSVNKEWRVKLLRVEEQSTPSTPDSGMGLFYFGTDGLPKALNDAGTEMDLYNTGGDPGLSILDNDTANQEVVNSAAETDVWSVTVPANTIGTNGALDVDFDLSYLNSSGLGRTLTIKLYFGGTAVTLYTNSIISNANRQIMRGKVTLIGTATNAQKYTSQIMLSRADLFSITDVASREGTWAIDQTADRVLKISVQHSAANANLSIIKKSVRLTHVPAL